MNIRAFAAALLAAFPGIGCSIHLPITDVAPTEHTGEFLVFPSNGRNEESAIITVVSLTPEGPAVQRRALGVPGDATSVACIGESLYVCLRHLTRPHEGALYRVPPDGSPAVLVLDLTHIRPHHEIVASGDRLVTIGERGLYEIDPLKSSIKLIHEGSLGGLAVTDRHVVFGHLAPDGREDKIGFLETETEAVSWLADPGDLMLWRGDGNAVIAFDRNLQRWAVLTVNGPLRSESTPVIDTMRRSGSDDAVHWCGRIWRLDRTEQFLWEPAFGVVLRDSQPRRDYWFGAYHKGPAVVWKPDGV